MILVILGGSMVMAFLATVIVGLEDKINRE